VRGGLPECRGL
jgi:large subunit ribosomal protein LP2